MSRYVIISPCRDEAAFARRTLDSVTRQTIPPALWVIVDDGSTDQTPQILAEYARRFDYIRVIRRADRGRRSVGPGVIDAFYAGYDTIDTGDFDYVCKLDLDLELPPGYFEAIIRRMKSDPRLGTCSGKPYYHDSAGKLLPETCGDDTSVGAAKFYRTDCFREIGGFVRSVMWDGIDCHYCRMHGWAACSWDDPELRFLHLRPMGSSDRSILTGRARHGAGQYYMGTSLWYILASALFRLSHRPVIIGSAAMLWGYLAAMAARKARYQDDAFRKYLRRYHGACLLYGKARAMQMPSEPANPVLSLDDLQSPRSLPEAVRRLP